MRRNPVGRLVLPVLGAALAVVLLLGFGLWAQAVGSSAAPVLHQANLPPGIQGPYGHGGMMSGSMVGSWEMGGGWRRGHGQQGNQQTATVDTPITQDQAVENAQQFLDTFMPGTKTGEVHSFYGYRTVDVERDGNRVGTLSVNGYSGELW
jgi:hypothetical protein